VSHVETGQDDADTFGSVEYDDPTQDFDEDVSPDEIEPSLGEVEAENVPEMPNAPAQEPVANTEIKPQKEKLKGPKKPEKAVSKGLWSNLRLPEWAVPYHYDATIDTQLDTFSFRGHVDIHLQLKKASSFVVFHAAMLSVNKVDIKNGNSQLFMVKNLEEHTDKEFWVASTQEEMGESFLGEDVHR
jgi:hypothetical protein